MKPAFTIIEVVTAVVVLTIIATSFFPILGWMITKSRKLQYDTQASLVLQEGTEVAYNIFAADWDDNWTIYSEGSSYHPEVLAGSGTWGLGDGAETGVSGRFDRKIEIFRVCRNNGDGKILTGACPPNSSTWDKSSRRVVTTVGWTELGKKREVSAQLLITKL